MVWTPENIERVRALADAGFSCSQIAYQIGGGVTRNSVVSIGHRAKPPIHFSGTVGRPTSERVKSEPKPQRFKEKISFVAAPDTPPPEPLMLTFDDLQPHDCRFIFGERAIDFKFCGLPALEGRAWCLHHARIVYQPLPERRR